jgi:hypothetical protein
MIDMIILIHFNTRFYSEITGRMFVVYYSKINELLGIVTSKSAICIEQNSKCMCKKPTFLSTSYCYHKKMFAIIPNFQKQTP